jgi:hypothetical protein
MKSKGQFVSAVVGAGVAFGAFALWSNAGDLNPPEGPIQPTLRTTQEIFNRIDMLTPGPFCDNGPWDTVNVQGANGVYTERLIGSGIVHAVVISSGRVRLADSGGARVLIDVFGPGGTIDVPSPGTRKIVLNIPYTDGLWSESGPAKTWVLYRADAPLE